MLWGCFGLVGGEGVGEGDVDVDAFVGVFWRCGFIAWAFDLLFCC